jgi:hypothetical protein
VAPYQRPVPVLPIVNAAANLLCGKVPNFAVVQNPINLFDGEADTNKIIQ